MAKKKEDSTQKQKSAVKYIIPILILIAIIIFLLLINRKYDVVFDENGGSAVEEVIVLRNHKVTEPKDPVKENYEFAGWYYNDELYDFSKPVTKNITLEAKWVVKSTLEVKTSELSLVVGASSKIEITSLPTGVTKDMLTYKSSNEKIITVDENGKIKALKAGNSIITITTPSGETVEVKVISTKEEVKVTGVSLNKNKLTLNVGDTSKLVATIKPSNATNKNVTWKSSNTAVVKVSGNGKIEALKVGTATITVTTKDGNYKATCTITVTKKDVQVSTIAVTGITLNKVSLELLEGASETLVATIKPTDATNKGVTWSSSNTSVAKIDQNGKITAIASGATTITVTTKDGGYKATCIVVVKEKEPNYVITVTKIAMEIGSTTFQHAISITKDGSAFNDYKGIIYNGDRIAKGNHLGDTECNTGITSATIVLSNGTEIKNVTVIYK